MTEPEARGSLPSGQNREGLSTEAGHAGADGLVGAMKPGNAGGAKGSGHPALSEQQLSVQEDSKDKARPKPFAIEKHVVWDAYRRVKTNKGVACQKLGTTWSQFLPKTRDRLTGRFARK